MTKEWSYLASEVFQQRCVLAANWLKECRTILDVGGYKTPINRFLTHDSRASVTVIDPRIKNSSLGPHRYINGLWQDHKIDQTEGIVILGIEIHAPESEWQYFINFIDSCQKGVIGVAEDHIHSVNMWAKIQQSLKKIRVQMQIGLDLRDNDFGDLTNSGPPYTKRKLYFLGR